MKKKCPYLPDNGWPVSENENIIDFLFDLFYDYLETTAKVKALFPPATVLRPPPALEFHWSTSGINVVFIGPSGNAVQVRSSEDDKKDLVVKLDQARSRLYLGRTIVDFAAVIISDVAYTVLFNGMEAAHVKARSARTDRYRACWR